MASACVYYEPEKSYILIQTAVWVEVIAFTWASCLSIPPQQTTAFRSVF